MSPLEERPLQLCAPFADRFSNPGAEIWIVGLTITCDLISTNMNAVTILVIKFKGAFVELQDPYLE